MMAGISFSSQFFEEKSERLRDHFGNIAKVEDPFGE